MSSINSAGVGGLAGGGNVTLNGGTLTVGGGAPAPTTYSGTIGGAGGLNLVGGLMTLGNSNNYTGATTLSGGTLKLASITSGGGNGTISLGSSNAWYPAALGNVLSYTTPSFTISGSTAPDLLLVEVAFHNDTNANVPTGLTFGGTSLTLASSSANTSGKITGAFIYYLAAPSGFSTTTGSLTLSFASTASLTDVDVAAFSLSGVNVNAAALPSLSFASSRTVGGTGNTLAVTMNGISNNSWEAFDTETRPGTLVTSTASITAATGGTGTLVGALGNLMNHTGTDMGAAGGLAENITASSLTITETGSTPAGSGYSSMAAAVFQPQGGGTTTTGGLPSTTALFLNQNAALDLGGQNQTVFSLSDGAPGLGGIVQNSGAAPRRSRLPPPEAMPHLQRRDRRRRRGASRSPCPEAGCKSWPATTPTPARRRSAPAARWNSPAPTPRFPAAP